jgi:ribosome-associated protein
MTPAPRAAGPAAAGLDSEALAGGIAAIASDRSALDIRLLDVGQVVAYTDVLLLCSGRSERQTRAIHDAIHQRMKDDHGLLPRRVEGVREARWILMDYLDCVVHIFTPEAREYYRLEQLWGEVPSRVVE